MRIRILKSIAGSGDFVTGSRHQFALDAGMVVEVEKRMAEKWIASGIACSAEEPSTPETTIRPGAPERAVLPRPRKGGK